MPIERFLIQDEKFSGKLRGIANGFRQVPGIGLPGAVQPQVYAFVQLYSGWNIVAGHGFPDDFSTQNTQNFNKGEIKNGCLHPQI